LPGGELSDVCVLITGIDRCIPEIEYKSLFTGTRLEAVHYQREDNGYPKGTMFVQFAYARDAECFVRTYDGVRVLGSRLSLSIKWSKLEFDLQSNRDNINNMHGHKISDNLNELFPTHWMSTRSWTHPTINQQDGWPGRADDLCRILHPQKPLWYLYGSTDREWQDRYRRQSSTRDEHGNRVTPMWDPDASEEPVFEIIGRRPTPTLPDDADHPSAR